MEGERDYIVGMMCIPRKADTKIRGQCKQKTLLKNNIVCCPSYICFSLIRKKSEKKKKKNLSDFSFQSDFLFSRTIVVQVMWYGNVFVSVLLQQDIWKLQIHCTLKFLLYVIIKGHNSLHCQFLYLLFKQSASDIFIYCMILTDIYKLKCCTWTQLSESF